MEFGGLKFGRKIYFEDSSSQSYSSPAGPKKTRSGPVQPGQPPRCQVEGCKLDLSDAKAYYSRHKVCGTHSKSAKVIVAGLEQRFCQQCSRFHLLPEFDQGKRSCRRRLAGHNERRRKPPPGSLFHSRYEGSGSKVGSFLMDFSAYSRMPERTGGQLQYLPPPPPSDLFLQTSACGTSITAGHGIPPAGECIPVVSVDSSCALSLLSNQQPWIPRNRSPLDFGLHSMMNNQPTAATLPHLDMLRTGSHQMVRDLEIGQISHELSHQQSRRPYSEPGHSRDFDSSIQHINWSL